MPKHTFFEAVPASDCEAKVSCYLGVPTFCPECKGKDPEKCIDFHASGQVSLAESAAPSDFSSIRLCPESMVCINCAAAKVVHYPDSAFGAGRCGPLGVEQVLTFCKKLSEARSQASAQGEKAVAVFCSDRKWACNNMLLLVGAYMIVEEDFTYQEVVRRLPEGSMRRLYPLPWRKAPLCCSSSVSVGDCLYGLEFAKHNDWFNFKNHGCKEYSKTLKTFDACAMFSIPIGPQAEHRLTFWAVGDPVTTVADPNVRPEPPKEGFVTDYEKVVDKAEWSRGITTNGEDTPRNRRLSQASDPVLPPKFGRSVSQGIVSGSTEATADPGSRNHSKEIRDESIPKVFFMSENVGMSQNHTPISEMDIQEGSGGSRGPSGGSSGIQIQLPERRQSFKDGPERRDSYKERDNWLEQERVRHWGLKQHLKSSSVPFAKIKTRGLITMPEFAEWLRVVKCRSLVRLNHHDEPNLPPGGSYGDYFTGWGITQKALQFEDGTQPPDSVVRDFQKLVTELQEELEQEGVTSNHSVVVHCTAGLGRTVTLLGAAAAQLQGMGGSEWLGWARMVRPGSVQTLEQERFLKRIKPRSDREDSGGSGKSCCESLKRFFHI